MFTRFNVAVLMLFCLGGGGDCQIMLDSVPGTNQC